MVYVTSILFGLGGAVLSAVLWITATLLLPIFLPYAISRITGTGGDSFGRVTNDSIWIAALVGFIIEFAWE